ncbi:MAG: DUF2061 domain-containing protein [Verrucomicrobiota bacterium]|jgi:uncharacterized membrane protein|nr:DUF2061 domain-containing protein [Verrucomicrobiota bacterium]|tara:strand:- start:1808 stop:2068 length:261 start_codon:yes stop_codon:yes gene_type:complete
MMTENAPLLTESPMRSALKGFTWRLVATFTTVVIAYCITGEQAQALQIGAIEFVVKFVVYYFHERAWVRVPFGQGLPKTGENIDSV